MPHGDVLVAKQVSEAAPQGGEESPQVVVFSAPVIGAIVHGECGERARALLSTLRGTLPLLLVCDELDQLAAYEGGDLELVHNLGLRACGARQKAGLRRARELDWRGAVVLRADPALASAVEPLRAALDSEELVLARRERGLLQSALVQGVGVAQQLLSGVAVRGLHSGAWAARLSALEGVNVHELSSYGSFTTELVYALAERGVRPFELEVGASAAEALGWRAGIGYAARALDVSRRAWLARQRRVLAFPGPAEAAAAPSVTAESSPTPPASEPAQASGRGRSLPVIDATGDVENSG